MSPVTKGNVLGVLFLLAGLAGIGAELWEHRTLHPFNGSIGVGLLVMGALLTDPASASAALSSSLSAVRDLLPWKGGGAPPAP